MIIKGFVSNCPASQHKGFNVGDEIVQIQANGASALTPVEGLSLEQVEKLIQGEAGKSIKFQLRRKGFDWWKFCGEKKAAENRA